MMHVRMVNQTMKTLKTKAVKCKTLSAEFAIYETPLYA